MPFFQKTAPFVISFALASAAYAQAPGAPAAPASQTGMQASSGASSASTAPQIPSSLQDFQASVPQGTASATPIPLTIGDAISRGLRANLGLLTNEQSSREIRAQRIRALSALLPKVTGQANAVEQQINLQTVGFLFSFPGAAVPKIIGPYGYQSVQANADVTLFDWSAISQYRSAREQTKAAALDVKNARDLVVLSVGYAYLQIISDAARITATQAEIDADNAVYTNALRRHDAGTAIGLDVLRSQVELKQRQQQLVAVTNQFAKDKLTLGRVIGLPVGQDFTVADPSPSVPLATVSLEEALRQAYEHRPDYQAAKARVLAAELMLRSAKAERYPTLTADGYYGDAGLHLFTNSHGVFNVTGSLKFNIFDGGRIKADILQQDAELRNRRNELENLRGQIDFDVRGALLDLNSAKAQLDVAQSNVQLATETVKQSRDRFAAGVTNTVEVVQAQQSLADANENLISAQYQYNVAKVSLARALGLAEQAIATYFAKQP
ncbi:MAG TPA: TolC family protein [Bryobacteraceae bacterium]|jgi:outer membrane protein TolC|nr:TolC family protein [Bryobacteraceae bacterium]